MFNMKSINNSTKAVTTNKANLAENAKTLGDGNSTSKSKGKQSAIKAVQKRRRPVPHIPMVNSFSVIY